MKDDTDFNDILSVIKDQDQLDNLERGILLTCLSATKQGQLYSETICYKNPETGFTYKDYANPYRNIIAFCLKEWRRLCGDEYKILSLEGVKLLVGHLSTTRPELVSMSELPEVVSEWEALENGKSYVPLAQNEKLVISWLKRVRTERTIKETSFKMHGGGKLNIDTLVERIHKDVSLAEMDTESRTEMMGFSQIMKGGKQEDKTVFMSTGVPILDKFLGGGYAKGYSYLFATGSGGGKTVKFVNVAVNLSVRQDYKGLWISTEEPPHEVYYRITSNYCNIPHDIIRKDMADGSFKLPPVAEPKFKVLEDKMDKNLQVIQWRNDDYNLRVDIKSAIKDFEKKMGQEPDYIIFDWLQPSISSLAGGNVIRNDLKSKTFEMDIVAKQTGISVFFAMQIGQQSSKVKFITPDCIDECKNAHQKVAAAICWSFIPSSEDSNSGAAGGTTIQEMQYLYIGKTRFSSGGWCPIKRNFAVQKFEFK